MTARLALWLASSLASAALLSLPLGLLADRRRTLTDLNFAAVLAISSIWLACDHAATTNTWAVGRDASPRFPRVAAWLTLVCVWIGVAEFGVHRASHNRPGSLVVGAGLSIAGAILRLSAIRSLGSFFSERLVVVPGQPLVTAGVFRSIRHPSYTGWLLILLGIVVLLESAWASAFYACVIVPMVLFRIHIEERVLLDAYGAAYVQYARDTKRLVPRLF